MSMNTSPKRTNNGRRSSEDFGAWFEKGFVFPPRTARGYRPLQRFSEGPANAQIGHKKRLSPSIHPQENTQDRLFGPADTTPSPRRLTNTFRSNIFASGDAMMTSEEVSQKTSISTYVTDGKKKSYDDGDHKTEFEMSTDRTERTIQQDFSKRPNTNMTRKSNKIKVRTPPGGVSNGLW